MTNQQRLAPLCGGFEAVQHSCVIDQQGLPRRKANPIIALGLHLRDKSVEVLVRAFPPEPRLEEDGFAGGGNPLRPKVTQDRTKFGIFSSTSRDTHSQLAERLLRFGRQFQDRNPNGIEQDGSAERVGSHTVPASPPAAGVAGMHSHHLVVYVLRPHIRLMRDSLAGDDLTELTQSAAGVAS